MIKLKFTKMHGAGNDFIVINATEQPFSLSRQQISQLADRQRGIGFDQLLVVGNSEHEHVDFSYRIFNADGGEVSQCGNGARCFVKFIHGKKLSTKGEIVVETNSGIIKPKLQPDGSVSVNMGLPAFKPSEIPFLSNNEQKSYSLLIDEKEVTFGVVSMGNPHAIFISENADSAPVATLGPAIENNNLFPERVNVNFMQICSRRRISLRVWERGVGETLSCGTGACASVIHGIRNNLLDSPCVVLTKGGELTVSWDSPGKEVILTGPAISVFDGEVEIKT